MTDNPLSAEPSDEALAEAVARRDQSAEARQAARAACEQLYLRHARLLLAFLSARVRRSDLEDTHQAVWELAWQHLPGGFRGGNFRAWLYRIARNRVIDQARKKQPQLLGDEGPAVAARGGAEGALEAAERAAVLRSCLDRLTPEMAALVRARLAGDSYEEICPRLGLKPERAHKLFHQAKEQMQTCVQRALS
jgi:RNA polymerase sigma-70 factor (ECF subfamily)